MEIVTVSQSYLAARETCARLYVAAGGDDRTRWNVHPYAGTAAISYNPGGYRGASFDLFMPAMPLDARLTRVEADLMAAYVVHELGHALYTDFGITALAAREQLARLLNGIEDARIEGKLAQLEQAPEARRLLESLTAHIIRRDTAKGFDIRNPQSFAFTLNCVLMVEGLGYRCDAFPAKWRKMLPARWVAVLDECLRRLPGLTSTLDALELARWVRDQLATGSGNGQQPQQQQQQQQQQQGDQQTQTGGQQQAPQEDNDDDKGEGKGEGEGEGDKRDDDRAQGKGKGKGDDDDGEGDDGEGEGDGADTGDDADTGDGEGDKGAGDRPGTGDNDGEGDDDNDDDGEPSKSGEDGKGGGAGRNDDAPVDMTDRAQQETEPDLSDIARDVCNRNGVSEQMTQLDNQHAEDFLRVQPCELIDMADTGNKPARVKQLAETIDSPARLRKHVRDAVKSPERVGSDRFQTSGRLDMRAMATFDTSAAVFRRRTEQEGIEAAVSLLLDMSGSMGDGKPGDTAGAAGALALHLGDALKSAGVPFEIAGFRERGGANGPSARLFMGKSFRDGWATDTKSRVSMLARGAGGTHMLPAMHEMAARLYARGHVNRRVLIVLTDGADGFSIAANRACLRHWAGRGVEIIGLGIFTGDYIQKVFGEGNAIDVNSLSDVSSAGLAALVKVLDPARVRKVRAAP